MKYGKFEVSVGDNCSNSPGIDTFTTPCCYSDQEEGDTECALCGAPILCEFEKVEIAVCTIRDLDEEE